VRLAARGARNMDDGIQKVDDERFVAQARKQAGKVQLKSMLAGAALTLLVFIIPS
jgi:hypothetical protein